MKDPSASNPPFPAPPIKAALTSLGLYCGGVLLSVAVLTAISQALDAATRARGLGHGDAWRSLPGSVLGGVLATGVFLSFLGDDLHEMIRALTGLRPGDAGAILKEEWKRRS